MLVVVHYGDVELSLEATLNLEALRGLDVFQIDASEGGGDGLYGLDELLGIFLIDFDVKHVDAGIYLEQQTLTLHHGLSCQCAYIAKAEHGGTVGDDSHEVALRGVVIGGLWILFDFETRLSYTG